MYINVYEIGHVFYSETRAYMALLMGAAMSIVMLGFMQHMLSNKKVNLAIFMLSFIVFAGALWLIRSQNTIDDIDWMKAMIPHHSIAILTSERANISDPEAQKLADTIIKTQQQEIEEMKKLINKLQNK